VCDCGGGSGGGSCSDDGSADCVEGVCVEGECIHEDGDAISDASDGEIGAAIEEAESSGGWNDEGGPLQHRLPFEAGVHMGITQGTSCMGHARLVGSVDFNVQGAVEASLGLKAVASQSGTVVKAVTGIQGFVAGSYGNYVIIRHPGAEYTLYGHLAPDSVAVREGDEVCQGQVLGVIGNTGHSSGDHLHYERRDAEQRRITPSFEELEVVPSGCGPCTTADPASGCYASLNALFCSQEQPEPPQLLAPDDGASFEVGDAIRFRFARSGSGDHFLKIRRIAPDDVVVRDAAVAGTESTLADLTAGSYRWTVYIKDDACIDGQCAAPSRLFSVSALAPMCGDGSCDADESSAVCCRDCGCGGDEICGDDGQCGPSGCATDADCPAEQVGPWGQCGGYNGQCGESGSKMRSTTSYTCNNGSCDATTGTREESCSRPTEGEPCTGGTCQSGACQSVVTCRMVPTPAVDTWTPNFTAQTNCSCSASATDCHTLYEGRATAVTGSQATLEFHKTPDNGGPSATVTYWVVVGESTSPSCLDLGAFVSRTTGTWAAGSGDLSVSGVDVWPTAAAFAADEPGATKKLFIITGGGGGLEGDRVWFQKQALVFTKVCD